jgi:allantoinase
MSELLIRGERVALPGRLRAASIQVRDGRIVAIGEYADRPAGVPTIDAGTSVVLPGVVDTHVHVNEPGRTDWEGFDHATRAAAAGGVTTIVDMPLNSVPSTIDAGALEQKRRAAAGRCHVDVGFWGGVVPGNTPDLEPLARAGVLGFKCFLCPSGVDEFQHVGEADLRQALPVLARLGVPLLAHAELPEMLHDPGRDADPRSYRAWLESRPPASEHAAIDLLLGLAREYGAAIHIVHLASPEAAATIAAARAAGVAVTVETCPHYLTIAAEDIPDGAPAFKCAPPIRERAARDGLWHALERGAIDLVATDHSPAPPALKRLEEGDVLKAWGGIASLQLGASAVWTGASARGLPIERLGRWLSEAPARLAGLAGRKGSIAQGHDADLAIIDPDATFLVDPGTLLHRHPMTPYAGMRLRGRVVTTVLRGAVVFDGERCTGAPSGRLITRDGRV